MDEQSRNANIVKTTQVLRYLLSFDDNGKMNRLKLIKLLWAADRYHIRHYGRLILDDEYVAMRFGPVASLALDVAQVDSNGESALDHDDVEFVGYYLSADKRNTTATAAKSKTNFLSETDKEALAWAWQTFGGMDAFDIAKNVSHNYPEWARFEEFFIFGRGRQRINPLDFFEDPSSKDEYFQQNKDELLAAKEMYTSHIAAQGCLQETLGVL